MNTLSCTIAGDILDTQAADLGAILAAGPWQVRWSDEVKLDDGNLSMEIYPSGIGRDFLVSGGMDGTPDAVRAAIEKLGALLAAGGLRYSFEIAAEDNPDNEFFVRHPDLEKP